VARQVLEPLNSTLAKLQYGQEEVIERWESVAKRKSSRGREFVFNLTRTRLQDGRERWLLSATNPKEFIDSAALVQPLPNGVVIQPLHGGVVGFKGLGASLVMVIQREFGQIVVPQDAPLSQETERFRGL